jgi:hypothetical protein
VKERNSKKFEKEQGRIKIKLKVVKKMVCKKFQKEIEYCLPERERE